MGAKVLTCTLVLFTPGGTYSDPHAEQPMSHGEGHLLKNRGALAVDHALVFARLWPRRSHCVLPPLPPLGGGIFVRWFRSVRAHDRGT